MTGLARASGPTKGHRTAEILLGDPTLACIEALSEEPVQVVLTTGHQPLPRRFGHLPVNFRSAPYLPGLSLAERCSLMIHHGGYGASTPGVPT